jgi:hypothetical protein
MSWCDGGFAGMALASVWSQQQAALGSICSSCLHDPHLCLIVPERQVNLLCAGLSITNNKSWSVHFAHAAPAFNQASEGLRRIVLRPMHTGGFALSRCGAAPAPCSLLMMVGGTSQWSCCPSSLSNAGHQQHTSTRSGAHSAWLSESQPTFLHLTRCMWHKGSSLS